MVVADAVTLTRTWKRPGLAEDLIKIGLAPHRYYLVPPSLGPGSLPLLRARPQSVRMTTLQTWLGALPVEQIFESVLLEAAGLQSGTLLLKIQSGLEDPTKHIFPQTQHKASYGPVVQAKWVRTALLQWSADHSQPYGSTSRHDTGPTMCHMPVPALLWHVPYTFPPCWYCVPLG